MQRITVKIRPDPMIEKIMDRCERSPRFRRVILDMIDCNRFFTSVHAPDGSICVNVSDDGVEAYYIEMGA